MSIIAKQVWPMVVKDMLERNEEGSKKYNRYLQTDCPDNLLQHAYEEALDLAVYLKTEIEKQKAQSREALEIEKVNNELNRLSKMDDNNCCVSWSRYQELPRDFILDLGPLFRSGGSSR